MTAVILKERGYDLGKKAGGARPAQRWQRWGGGGLQRRKVRPVEGGPVGNAGCNKQNGRERVLSVCGKNKKHDQTEEGRQVPRSRGFLPEKLPSLGLSSPDVMGDFFGEIPFFF